MRRHSELWLWLAGLAGPIGCLLVTPLDPPPEETSIGGSGDVAAGGATAGKTAGGGSSTNAGEGGAPPVAGATGEGGEVNEPCATHVECSQAGFDEPYRCLDGACVKLATLECPLVYGDSNDPNAIFIGAYATPESRSLADSTAVFTYRLALDEFNRSGGLPGPNGRRPLVTILCDNAETHLDKTMQHLTEDVQVPAILAALDTGPLLRAFETYGRDRVFFLSPFGSSRELSNTSDGGLIWSMLGQPSDFSAIYASLLSRLESFLLASYPIERLRVLTVRTEEAFSSELADAVLASIRFNDASASDNLEAGSLLPLTLPKSGDDHAFAELMQTIYDFAPHVVVSVADESFVAMSGVLRRLEQDWGGVNGGKLRPHYILSPKNFDRIEDTVGPVVRAQGLLSGNAHHRFLVVGAAPAEDRTLYNEFLVRLAQAYPKARRETENLYDAFYFLAYSIHAAGNVATLTGPAIAEGMQRLMSTDPRKEFAVGPLPMSDAFTALSTARSTIRLMGTLGPPEFDIATGSRIEPGSVTCFDEDANLHEHVLRFDIGSQSLVGDLSPCFAGF